MRITKIENQKKRAGRKNIYADGAFLAGASDETILRLKLRTGDELTPDVLDVLRRTEELYSARTAALRYLSHRPRTEREIRDKLREKEFSDADISRTLAELRQAGLVDDREFARMYVRDALAVRPIGKLLVRRKLLLLGVAKELVDDIVGEFFGPDSEKAAALAAGRKFLSTHRSRREERDPRGLRVRLSAYLARRGYGWDVIQPVMKDLLSPDSDPELSE